MVTTNDPEHPSETLTCQGRILDAIAMTPPRLNFGQLSRVSEELTRKADLRRGDGGPIKPEVRPLNSQNFKVDLKEITPGEHYELTVTLVPPVRESRAYAKLEIMTGVSESPSMTIPLYASVPPRVVANPRHIIVPPQRTGDWEQVVELIWDDPGPHRILSTNSSDEGLKTRIDEQGGKQRVVFTVPEGYQPSSPAQRITIQTDDTVTPTVTVPVSLRPTHPATSSTAPRPPGVSNLPDSVRTTPKVKARSRLAPNKAPSTSDSE